MHTGLLQQNVLDCTDYHSSASCDTKKLKIALKNKFLQMILLFTLKHRGIFIISISWYENITIVLINTPQKIYLQFLFFKARWHCDTGLC